MSGLLAGGIASALPLQSIGADESAEKSPSLKALAAKKGLLFGSCIGIGAFADPRYLNILKNECSVLVPENELKSYVIAREPGRLDFAPGDRIAAFARTNGMKLRGHTLLWNRVEFMPKWLLEAASKWSAAEAERFLRDYVRAVCTHYAGQIHSWDVVNETVDPKTGQVRETPFTKLLGFDALRIVYEVAREHSPSTQLVYNDYMSWEAGVETHRAGVLRLLEQFKSRNIPVDAFGIQSHMGNDGNIHAGQRKEWKAFVDAAVGMGYKLLITELDVNDKDLPADIKTRDAQAAAVTQDYLDFMLAYRELDQVLCWGMLDKYTWLQDFSPRKDKLPQRSTPYDAAYKAKPLREAIAKAFEAAPLRRA